MKTKYYQYTLKGELSATDAQATLGDALAQETIVRIDTGGGHTLVYTATQSSRTAKPPLTGVSIKEVTESDVTKLG